MWWSQVRLLPTAPVFISNILEALFNSFILVLISEMGDKSQILSLILTSRYRKPYTVLGAVFVASAFNQMLAVFFGYWVSLQVPEKGLALFVAAVFLAFGFWMLFSNANENEEPEVPKVSSLGLFLTAVLIFSLSEMGDKTQIAASALSAHYQHPVGVWSGSTLGMTLANAAAIFVGHKTFKKISIRKVQRLSAVLFLVFAAIVLWGALAQ